MFSSFLALLVVLSVVVVIKRWRSTSRSFPPGPKPLPLIGNILDIPKTKPWVHYHNLYNQYGDLLFLRVPGQPILVLGSAEATTDLLEKRSHIYSDRPQLKLMKLISWDFSMGMMPYGVEWRSYRRTFHQHFNQNEIASYRDIQRDEVRDFLARLFETPQHAGRHVRHLVVSTILRIVYGRKINRLDDPFLILAQKALDGANIAAAPGENLVEFFPFLQHIPDWLPGGHTQRVIKEYRPLVETMLSQPIQELKELAADGKIIPCMASTLLLKTQERYGNTPIPAHEERLIRDVTGDAYFGGADTSSSTGLAFLVAMAMFPEVQIKAHEELDRVVGPDRLPNHEDIESLVYIQAVVMELLRWLPVGPLAVPHRLTEDDEYRGYFIPKGTLVFPNTWAIAKNPEDYPEPDAFKPERFIKDGKINTEIRDPNTYAFGYGRRICPGRFLGKASLALFTASTLHVFNISPGSDEDGKPIVLSTDVCDGFISQPLTIPRGFTPRSQVSTQLICELTRSI